MIKFLFMSSSSFLLYGANGYTGQLIAETAALYGLTPVIAGRNEEMIRALAGRLGLSCRVFDLHQKEELARALEEVPLVLNCAGPFRETARIMIEACLIAKKHYLDITGEVPVLEMVKQYQERAKEAGIMVMSGTGFDVVPTDCLALLLKNRLPDACALKLAFAPMGGGMSRGTAITTVASLGEKGAVRENGRLVQKPLGHKGLWLELEGKRVFVMTIPWGDIATAWHTTGIPNIETYTAFKPAVYRLLKVQFLFNWLLRRTVVRTLIKKWIHKKITGPTPEVLRQSKVWVWGEVRNAEGKTLRAGLVTSNAYDLTAHSGLLIAKKVLEGNYQAGYQTPAGAYGEGLVLEIPGVTRIDEME